MKLFILVILTSSHLAWSISPDENTHFGVSPLNKKITDMESKINDRIPSADSNKTFKDNKLLAAPKEANNRGEKKEN